MCPFSGVVQEDLWAVHRHVPAQGFPPLVHWRGHGRDGVYWGEQVASKTLSLNPDRSQAESNMNDLISEYQQYQEATVDDDEYEGDGDDLEQDEA